MSLVDNATVTVKRANVVLRVKEDAVESYLNRGFDVIDSLGNVVRETTKKDIPTLEAKVHKLEAEVEELKAETAELKSKVEAKKRTKKEA